MTAITHTMLESAAALSARVPAPAEPDGGDADAVPRVLTWAVVKRIDPRLPNTWGHWWIELDGQESYGWWPTPCPMGWRGAMLGSRGCLNGIGAATEGTATRDAYHGDEPDHWFHPTLLVAKSDEQVRADIRAFAHSYVGDFRWQWWWLRGPAQNCRTFQQEMFETAGLFEEPEYLYTQGPGCPFMFELRSAKWRVLDLLAAAFGWMRFTRRKCEKREAVDPETAGRQVNGAARVENAGGQEAAVAASRTPGVSRPDGAALAALRLSSKRGRRARGVEGPPE
jgi:hypothetical protein